MYLKLLLILLTISVSGYSYAQISEEAAITLIESKYSQEEITEMKSSDPVKYKKLVFYYANSWILVRNENAETQLDENKIDVSRFEVQRAKDQRTEIIISQYNDKLVLLSQNELDEAYKKIESEETNN